MREDEREELLRRIEAGERIPFSERRPVWASPPEGAEVGYLAIDRDPAETSTALGCELDDEPTVET